MFDELHENIINTFYTYYNYEDIESKLFARMEKDWSRIVKGYVSTTRPTIEYRKVIKFLKVKKNVNINFMEKGTDIEFHHAPFSLFAITQTVLAKRIINHDPIDTFSVCNEVMSLHYENKIGLIPLNSSLHFHVEEKTILIPPNLIHGNWNEFVNEYGDYFFHTVANTFSNYRRKFLLVEQDNNKNVDDFLEEVKPYLPNYTLLSPDIRKVLEKHNLLTNEDNSDAVQRENSS